MKKTLITIIIIGLVLLVAGKVILLVTDKNDETMSINSDLSLSDKNLEIKDGLSSQTSGNYEIINNDFDNVENIKLSLGVYAVLIQSDDSIDKVKITAKKPKFMQNGKDIDKLEMKLNNGTLTIEQEQHKGIFGSNNFNLDNIKGELIINIPTDYNLDEIEIENGVGKIEIKDLSFNTLDIDCGTSSVLTNNLKLNKCYISGGTGSVKFNNTVTDSLEIDSGTGSTYYNGDILQKAIISTGTSGIELDLSGNEADYHFDIETGLGSIEINDNKYKKEVNLNSSAKRTLEIDAGTGSVNIKTK